ncbi:MAG TPA: metallophosphoesterase family protein [Terriglobales bacterium]|jgi:predicted phosphodiesterase|nr:metallophosphoesterase family protein [Terriglobales bacterium]
MRIAIVSDIHGNRTAFEAVLADLRQTSPDLVLHGGDLADSGSSPAEIVDRIRDLGWNGVLGNTDEIHSRPDSLEEFASQSSAPPSLWTAVREMADATHSVLGEERVAWLRTLPRLLFHDSIVLLHASPDSPWRSPGPEASDEELEMTYGTVARPLVVYGHIHRSFVRRIPRPGGQEICVANTGSVSLSYDGDPRAAYLLIDESGPIIRRVEYDLERELQALSNSGLPHTSWVSKILRRCSPQLP